MKKNLFVTLLTLVVVMCSSSTLVAKGALYDRNRDRYDHPKQKPRVTTKPTPKQPPEATPAKEVEAKTEKAAEAVKKD